MSVLERVSGDAFTALVSLSDFDCLPRGHQTLELARFLLAQGVTRFTAAEVSELFAAAGMVSPRSTQPIRCSPTKVAEYIRKFIAGGKLPLRAVSSEEFEA
jgi:hypothetical protein